jgi:hypothetical protein
MIFRSNTRFNKTAAVSIEKRGWFSNVNPSGKPVPGSQDRQDARVGSSGIYGLLVSNGATRGQWF